MKKYKELIKNMGLLTLSNFGSKILSFFLVPLYTAVLSTKDYGNFDFVTVTASLLIPLLTLNISEGALRFLLDKEKNKKQIFNICTKIIVNANSERLSIANAKRFFLRMFFLPVFSRRFCGNLQKCSLEASFRAITAFIGNIYNSKLCCF